MLTRILAQRCVSFGKSTGTVSRRHFATTRLVRAPKFDNIHHTLSLEEEIVAGYKADDYYPVHIGQVFQDRYRTIGKLGYGSASTVWLCRDLQQSKYATLKVYINRSKTHRERPIYERINAIHSEHEGRHHVRQLYDSFKIDGPHGTHVCLVHQPMGMTLADIVSVRPGRVLSTGLVRELFRFVIRGLQYLHDEVNSNGIDLQPNNILMGVMDDQVFEKFEYYENQNPCPRKELRDRTIYISRPMPFSAGAPSLSDLSEARFGDVSNSGDIMPDRYRAPEVILDMPWSYPVDIWSLGMVIWDLFEGTPLFPARDPEDQYSERYHLAQMVAIMGPPSLDFLQKSDRSNRFWNSDGTWKTEIPIPEISLESAEHQLEGEEKELFLVFMRKMLQWKPEDRCNCHDIFFDEWLLADLIAEGIVEVGEEQS